MTTAKYAQIPLLMVPPRKNNRIHLTNLAWNFYIGGYQPAKKWLKDSKGRVLDFEDIMHYQRIIKTLTETDRVMKEIDGVGFMEGGEG